MSNRNLRLSVACVAVTVVTLAVGHVSAQQIPAGTPVTVRTIDAIDSRTADVNRLYRAALDEDLIVGNVTVAPKGADVTLRVAQVEKAEAVRGRAALALQLSAVLIDGQMQPVTSADVKSESGSQAAKATKTGVGGAVVGGVIGGILGGAGGAAKGAAIGGGAGVGVAALSGQRVQVAAETRLTFTTSTPAAPASAPAPLSASAPAPVAPAPSPSITTAEALQIRFDFAEATAQGGELTVKLAALNDGVDRRLGHGGSNQRNSVQIVDDSGSSYEASTFFVANSQNSGPIVNGVRTTLTATFKDLPTVGGMLQASEIKRLQLTLFVRQGQARATNLTIQLRNLPIRKTGGATN